MTTTRCPQCGHRVQEGRRCIYCGASQVGGPADRRTISSAETGVLVQGEVCSEELHGLPEDLWQGADEVVLEEKAVVETGPVVPEDQGEAALPPRKMIDALGKMKAALQKGQLEQDFYRHVATSLILDFVESLPGGERVRFVAGDLEDSVLAPYVDDGMKKVLMSHALAETDRRDGEKG